MAQDQAVYWLGSVGPWALIALMVLNRVGVPTWAAVLLVAAGGFAQRGTFNSAVAVSCALLGLTMGDLLAYSLGRQSVQRIADRFEQRQILRQARSMLARHSSLAILLSRFLFLFLAVPINFLASSMQVGRVRFILVTTLGNLIFVAVYFSVGYLFSGNWATLWRALTSLPLAVYMIAGLIGAAVMLSLWLSSRQRTRRG